MKNILLVLLFLPSIALGNQSYFDDVEKNVVCEETLPLFTLSETSQPTRNEVITLCTCIWQFFPNGGWEQRVAEQIRNGQDAGWRARGFPSSFGKAYAECGGYDL